MGQDSVMRAPDLKSLWRRSRYRRQRYSSRVRNSVTSGPDPGVPGIVLILGEGTVPAEDHIRKLSVS